MTRREMIFNRPIEMAEHNPVIVDDYLPPTTFASINLSNQNLIMNGHEITLPSVMQSETINSFVSNSDAFKGASVISSYPTNSDHIQSGFPEGLPLSSVSLAYLLASRNEAYNSQEKFVGSSATLPNFTEVTRCLGSSTGVFDPMCDQFSGFDRANVAHVNPNVWFLGERVSSSSDSPSGSSRFSNELSLSLTATPPQVGCGTTPIRDHFSEMSCSGVTSGTGKSISLHRPVQLSQFVSGSRYLSVMQEILSQIARYSLEDLAPVCYQNNVRDDSDHIPFSLSCSAGRGFDSFPFGPHRSIAQLDAETRRKHLLALLQAVDDHYNQCLDELHMVVSAFHAVTELHPDRHAHFALQTVSFLYKSLRDRIGAFILAMGEQSSSSGRGSRDDKSFEASFIRRQWTQQLRKKEHQLWRPQRGLPERSVSVLRAWMFQNFLHPYPKDTEKHLLAVKSGLTRSQVSNWFINARVRLWKPMIEEMYAEMNRRNHHHQDEEEINGCRNQRLC